MYIETYLVANLLRIKFIWVTENQPASLKYAMQCFFFFFFCSCRQHSVPEMAWQKHGPKYRTIIIIMDDFWNVYYRTKKSPDELQSNRNTMAQTYCKRLNQIRVVAIIMKILECRNRVRTFVRTKRHTHHRPSIPGIAFDAHFSSVCVCQHHPALQPITSTTTNNHQKWKMYIITINGSTSKIRRKGIRIQHATCEQIKMFRFELEITVITITSLF